MNANSLTLKLKEYALLNGVDLFGITSAKSFIKKGRVEVVIDPKDILVDAKSVVVAAFYMNENACTPLIDIDNPKGRFTYGYSIRAYTPMENHIIKIIKNFLRGYGYKAVSNKNYKIPDKIAAVRAGLGKYGKNSVIITKKYGSFVMLVTLVTNAPLEYEEFDINTTDCGKCDICLKACPTRAIFEPFKVHRELCITAWLWGTFVPVNLRENQENRIFGCGECVKACPKNKRLAPREEYPIKIDDVSMTPELIPLVTGDEEYYRKSLASFTLCAGIEAIRGNAIIALGNIGTSKAINPLCITLTYPKPQIRAYSAWSLGKIGGVKAQKILVKALKTEKNKNVRKEIEMALGE